MILVRSRRDVTIIYSFLWKDLVLEHKHRSVFFFFKRPLKLAHMLGNFRNTSVMIVVAYLKNYCKSNLEKYE